MVKIYKVYEDFEIQCCLATETGVISIANNCINNMEEFTGMQKFNKNEFEKAKHFLENRVMLNVKELDSRDILEELENITTIEYIGNGYIEIY